MQIFLQNDQSCQTEKRRHYDTVLYLLELKLWLLKYANLISTKRPQHEGSILTLRLSSYMYRKNSVLLFVTRVNRLGPNLRMWNMWQLRVWIMASQIWHQVMIWWTYLTLAASYSIRGHAWALLIPPREWCHRAEPLIPSLLIVAAWFVAPM